MSVNQSLKPITTEINDKGNLTIGGCDLSDLAKKYGTPLYIIDEATLRGICREYKNDVCLKSSLHFCDYQNLR